MSEPKGEPTRGVLEGLKPFLAWLPAVELIGRSPVREMNLEETADVEKEQRQHRDPGAD